MLFLLVAFFYLLTIFIVHMKFFNKNFFTYFTKYNFEFTTEETSETFKNKENASSMMNGMPEFMKKNINTDICNDDDREEEEDDINKCINNELESYLDEINVTSPETYEFKPVPTSTELKNGEEGHLQNIQSSNKTDSELINIQAYDDFSNNFFTF